MAIIEYKETTVVMDKIKEATLSTDKKLFVQGIDKT